MLLFGIEEWSEQADGFGAYFKLLSRMSALCADKDGIVYRRRPLSGLTDMPVGPGTIALVCAVIGTTTFDGFSNDVVWRKLEPHLQSVFGDVGFHQTPAIELAYTVGLLLCVALIAGGLRARHQRRPQRQPPLQHRLNSATASRTRSCRSASPMCSRTTSRC